MIKRSFRFGLVVGVLTGLVVALAKTLGGRAHPAPAAPAASSSGPWPRLDHDPAVPAAPARHLVPDPDAPTPGREAAVAEPPAAKAEATTTIEVAAATEDGPTTATAGPKAAAAKRTAVPETPSAANKPAAGNNTPAAGEAGAPKKASAPEKARAAKKRGAAKKTSAANKDKTAKKVAATKKGATAKKTGASQKPATAKKTGVAKGSARSAKAAPRAWVEPEGEVCPTSHPVKAKLASKIFHQPGGLSYARTRPDRCYRDAESAEADGLRAAKR